MKILFCLLGETGHINPYIGPAQALQQIGHEVLISSPYDLSERMRIAGLPFSKELLAPPEAVAPRGKAFVDLIEDKNLHKMIIEEHFLKGIHQQVIPIKNYFFIEKPDAVVVDPMNYAAAIAAHLLDIPRISISSSLTSVVPDDLNSHVLEVLKEVAPLRKSIFDNYNYAPKFRAIDCLSPLLNITFATEEFIGKTHDDVSLVGPSIPLNLRGDETALKDLPSDKKIIYVSFGSQLYYYPQLFKKVQAACADLPVHLVMSVGELAQEDDWIDQNNMQVYAYAPQLEILRRASLFITHGGANSVMESLRAGVPMLIHPICNDQDHQAHFIEKSGVGQKINLKEIEITALREKIQELLNDEKIKKRVNKVSKSYQINGAKKAAELIIKTLTA